MPLFPNILQIELPQLNYTVGEEVNGSIRFTPKENFACSSVWVYLTGYVHLPPNIDNEPESLKKKKIIVLQQHVVLYIDDEKSTQPRSVSAGTYNLPFRFTLPDDLPPSTNHRDGKLKIVYNVKAFVDQHGRSESEADKPWGHAIKKEKKIFIGLYYEDDATYIPDIVRKQKTFKLPSRTDPFKASKDPLILEAQLEKAVTWHGDTIRVRVNLENHSARRVHSISLKLQQIWRYRAVPIERQDKLTYDPEHEDKWWDEAHQQYSHRTETIVVSRKQFKDQFPIQQGETYSGVLTLSVDLPELQPTVANCVILNTSYFLQVKCNVLAGRSLKALLPITITSYPLESANHPTQVPVKGPLLRLLKQLAVEKKDQRPSTPPPRHRKPAKEQLKKVKPGAHAVSEISCFNAIQEIEKNVSHLNRATYFALSGQLHQLIYIPPDANRRSSYDDLMDKLSRFESSIAHLIHLTKTDASSKGDIGVAVRDVSVAQEYAVESLLLMAYFIQDLSQQQCLVSFTKVMLLAANQLIVISQHAQNKIHNPHTINMIDQASKQFMEGFNEVKNALFTNNFEIGELQDILGTASKAVLKIENELGNPSNSKANLLDLVDTLKALLQVVYELSSTYSLPKENILPSIEDNTGKLVILLQVLIPQIVHVKSLGTECSKVVESSTMNIFTSVKTLLKELMEVSRDDSVKITAFDLFLAAIEPVFASAQVSVLPSPATNIYQDFYTARSSLEKLIKSIPPKRHPSENGDEPAVPNYCRFSLSEPVEELINSVVGLLEQIGNAAKGKVFQKPDLIRRELVTIGKDLYQTTNELIMGVKASEDMERLIMQKRNIINLNKNVVVLSGMMYHIARSLEIGGASEEEAKKMALAAAQLEVTVRSAIKRYHKFHQDEAKEDGSSGHIASKENTQEEHLLKDLELRMKVKKLQDRLGSVRFEKTKWIYAAE